VYDTQCYLKKNKLLTISGLALLRSKWRPGLVSMPERYHLQSSGPNLWLVV